MQIYKRNFLNIFLFKFKKHKNSFNYLNLYQNCLTELQIRYQTSTERLGIKHLRKLRVIVQCCIFLFTDCSTLVT